MTSPTLTGQAATEALKLYTRLGNADAGFNAGKVARAVRSTLGRARLAVDLFRSLRHSVAVVRLSRRTRARNVAVTRMRRSTLAGASPSRPRPPKRGRR